MNSTPDHFSPTRWTLVVRAGKDDPTGQAALADLCEAYWQPVFRFLRSEGRSDDAARELTQEFFARLLKSRNLGGADPSMGKFRTYLLGAVKHFLADERDKAQRQKRGGGIDPEPLPNEATSASGPRVANPIAPTADTYFDREWALLILSRALTLLEEEMTAAGKGATFAVLKPWLTGASADLTQAQAAAQLNLNEGAVKVAVHRLRQRYREAVRAEIAATVAAPEEVDQEVRYLVEVLSS
jgi:RNA polymerase sigma factor (sigma-70 family)